MLTPQDRERILALVVVPAGRPPLSMEEFLRGFGSVDGLGLGLNLLRDAVARRDPVDVELSLIVCFRVGMSDGHLALLIELAFADWHRQHEDVAIALGEIRSPSTIDALTHLATWVPDYLDYDDARALATKAIWALGAIDGDAARQALESLACSDDHIVAEGAKAQIEK
jgi:hypothetical protein